MADAGTLCNSLAKIWIEKVNGGELRKRFHNFSLLTDLFLEALTDDTRGGLTGTDDHSIATRERAQHSWLAAIFLAMLRIKGETCSNINVLVGETYDYFCTSFSTSRGCRQNHV